MGLIADLCYFAMVQVIYNNNREIPMSAHYKLPWFVSRVSPAFPHLSYPQRHWLVSFNLSYPFDYSSRLLWLPAHTVSFTLITFTPTFKLQYLLTLPSSNMHSYATLPIIVMALSTAFPAFSAPVW